MQHSRRWQQRMVILSVFTDAALSVSGERVADVKVIARLQAPVMESGTEAKLSRMIWGLGCMP